MLVTHISEEVALRTVNALLGTVPTEARADRSTMPALVESWIKVMEQEFVGYQYIPGFGLVVKVV